MIIFQEDASAREHLARQGHEISRFPVAERRTGRVKRPTAWYVPDHLLAGITPMSRDEAAAIRQSRSAVLGPARIYDYGARPPLGDTNAWLPLLRKASDYRNALVEAERRRREQIQVARRERYPELVAAEADLDKVDSVLPVSGSLEGADDSVNTISRISIDALHTPVRRLWSAHPQACRPRQP